MKRDDPPPNYELGLLRSAEVRSTRSKEHVSQTWAFIVGSACGLSPGNLVFDPHSQRLLRRLLVKPPRTLQEFAVRLNEGGRRTATGLPWTASTVHRVFQAHDSSPKELHASLLPQPFVQKPKRPTTGLEVAGLEMHSDAENRFGRWVPASLKPPNKGDWVRLRVEVGEYQVGTRFRVVKRRGRTIAGKHFLLFDEMSLDYLQLDRWMEHPSKVTSHG